jgi:hypothetical protein
LSLRKAIDLVVEKQDLAVEVAAQHVHRVVAADRSASPSPVMIHTSSSGLASLMPVAKVGARPWIVWKP